MEMRKLEDGSPPPLPPHSCYLCKSEAGGQVDVGKVQGNFKTYLCQTCVGQAADLIGWLDAAAAQVLNDRIDAQAVKIASLEGQLSETGNDAQAVELARRYIAAVKEMSLVAVEAAANPQLTTLAELMATPPKPRRSASKEA